MPVREFDCLRLGTAMKTPVDQTTICCVLKNPPAYDDSGDPVKGGALEPASPDPASHPSKGRAGRNTKRSPPLDPLIRSQLASSISAASPPRKIRPESSRTSANVPD